MKGSTVPVCSQVFAPSPWSVVMARIFHTPRRKIALGDGRDGALRRPRAQRARNSLCPMSSERNLMTCPVPPAARGRGRRSAASLPQFECEIFGLSAIPYRFLVRFGPLCLGAQ